MVNWCWCAKKKLNWIKRPPNGQRPQASPPTLVPDPVFSSSWLTLYDCVLRNLWMNEWRNCLKERNLLSLKAICLNSTEIRDESEHLLPPPQPALGGHKSIIVFIIAHMDFATFDIFNGLSFNRSPKCGTGEGKEIYCLKKLTFRPTGQVVW